MNLWKVLFKNLVELRIKKIVFIMHTLIKRNLKILIDSLQIEVIQMNIKKLK
jgi:hypothetical protein